MSKFIYLLLGVASLIVFILFIRSSVALDHLYPQLQTNTYTNIYNYIWALVPLALVVFLIIYSRKKSRLNISGKQVLIVIGSIVGVIAVIIFAGWFLIAGPSPLSRFPSQQESQNQTSDWKTYSSSKFTVKYPVDYVIDSSFGEDGVEFDPSTGARSFSCQIYIWPSTQEVFSDSDNIRWRENITINGVKAERVHNTKSTLYDFETIVIKQGVNIYELSTNPSADRKTCNLIFSTFTITQQ